MSEKIEIKKYHYSLSNINLIVNLHQSISKGTAFENNLIYYDSNFENYLYSLLESPFHYFYVLEINGTIEGFIHIRFIDDFLFLNNIALNRRFKGRSLGKLLLTFALNDLSKTYGKEIVFKLDVFESNTIALKWYSNLGFKEESRKEWFIFHKASLLPTTISRYIEHKDVNGFNGIYEKGNRIATIVSGNLILHQSVHINSIDFSKYNKILSDDCCFQKLPNIDKLKGLAETIDVSIRMKNTVKDILIRIRL